jgi:hypothetical protein
MVALIPVLVSCDQRPEQRGNVGGSADRQGKAPVELHVPLPTKPSNVALSVGQLIYVPVYSSIHTKSYSWQGNLASTLSIRNTAFDWSIELTRVDYFDSKGNAIESFLEEPLEVGPMESMEFLIEAEDVRGGMSAAFLVEWSSQKAVTEPLVEVVNVFNSVDKAFAFKGRSKVLRDDGI